MAWRIYAFLYLTSVWPAALLLSGLSAVSAWLPLYGMSLYAFAAGCLLRFHCRKHRVLMGFLSLVPLLAAAFLGLPWQRFAYLLIPVMLLCVLSLSLLHMRSGEMLAAHASFRIAFFGALGVYLVCQWMTGRADVAPAFAGFRGQTGIQTASFLIQCVVYLLCQNQEAVYWAGHRKNRAPRDVRRKNLFLTMALSAAVVLLASIPVLVHWMEQAAGTLFQWLKAAIRFLMQLLPRPGSVTGAGGEGGGAPEFIGAEAAETSLFWQILEKILYVAAILLAVLLLFIAFRVAARKLRSVFLRLRQRIQAFLQSASEDYADEITDIREEVRQEKARRNARKARFARVSERKLSPRERIRYRYYQMENRHPEWALSTTARKVLPADGAGIYEKARYSREEIALSDAEAFDAATH